MDFATAIAQPHAEIIPVISWALDSGAERAALGRAVETSAAPYPLRLAGLGRVSRRLATPWSGPQSTTISLSLANADRHYNALDPDKYAGRDLTLALAVAGVSELATVFTGPVTSFEATEGELRLTASDRLTAMLGQDAKWYKTLSPSDWPGLASDAVDKVMPPVVGVHDSIGAGSQGMVKGIKLSPTLYLLAYNACAAVPRIYEAGSRRTTGFSVNRGHTGAGGIGGYLTLVEFTSPPTGAITADVMGLTDDLTPDGAVLTDPIDIARSLVINLFGLSASQLDTTKLNKARRFTKAMRMRARGVFDQAKAPSQILYQLLSSFGLMFADTREGKWAVWALDPEALAAETAVPITRADMAPGSFRFGQDANAVCNDLRLSYLYSWAGGGYAGLLLAQDAASQADLAKVHSRNFSSQCAADHLSAWAVKELHLGAHSRAKRLTWQSWRQLYALELGRKLAITTPFGPGKGDAGWSGESFILTGLDYEFAGAGLAVQCRDIRPLLEKAA